MKRQSPNFRTPIRKGFKRGTRLRVQSPQKCRFQPKSQDRAQVEDVLTRHTAALLLPRLLGLGCTVYPYTLFASGDGKDLGGL